MEWLEPAQAIVLLLLGAAATYLSQRHLEKIRSEREKLSTERVRAEAAQARLRDDRVRVYTAVLDPYIEVLHQIGRGLTADEANQRLSSVDHRKAAFQLKILGSDDVVRAFNSFGRYLVDAKRSGADAPGEILRRWAALIFAIRQSIGEESTGLSEVDMIVDWVGDIETVYPELGAQQSVGTGGALSMAPGESAGTFARIGARHISMQRLDELRLLARRYRDGELTDDEVIDLFARIPDAPGAEVLLAPESYFTEGGEPMDACRPREFLNAIERHRRGVPEYGDEDILKQLVRFMRRLRGRRISVLHPPSGSQFEIRA